MCGFAITPTSSHRKVDIILATRRKKAFAAVMAACMFLTMQAPVSAQTGDSIADAVEEKVESSLNAELMGTNREDTYSAYYDRNVNNPKPDAEIVIEAGAGYTADATRDVMPEIEVRAYEGVDDCLVWTNHYGTVTYTFNVEKAGNYCLELLYYTIGGDNTTIDVGLLLDGEYPFSACNSLSLDRYWADSSAIKIDTNNGNQIRPTQKEYDMWVTYPIKDKEGLFNDPYSFYLSEGEHTLTLEAIKMNIALKSLTFKNYDAAPEYVAPSQEQIDATPALTNTNDINTNTIFIQAEQPLYKTSTTLGATYDRTSYLTNPSHPTKQRYNTIGQATWDSATQAITWEFSVPADGYYRFSFKARQNTMRGMFSNRRIYIDGVVPNSAMEDVQFKYDPNWYVQGINDANGNEVYVYLESGKHTITMEAIPGSIGDVMRRLDDLIYTLNYYYRRILMITSPDPDEYNDYFVDTSIPELIDTYEYIIDRLYAEKAGIEEISGQGSEAAILESLAVILERCVEEKDEIPQLNISLKDYISSVSAWMRDYRDQPLELDYIEVATVHENFSSANGNFFEDFAFGFNAFIGSFFEDYTKLSATTEKSLNVWVSQGRDQATVIKELVENDFNANNDGIDVSIALVQGSVIEASLANKGPDIALFLGGDFPIQLAARDLLVDLSQFKDYEDIVSERFTDTIETLYSYNGGVYGLPVSQTFPMMFYRTDILEELGIEKVPETWDDIIQVVPVLQRSYLTMGLLSPTSNLSSSIFESGDTFAMLVLQTGRNIYTDDLSKTTFDQHDIVKAFEQWTKFYTVFDFEQTYDAFSRFRTGEMPIVIQNYTFYNQLAVAAPEIKGLWDFAHVPGTVREDGTVDYSANSSSAGAIIFKKVTDPQAAWTFVKWFTSTEVQVEYGRTIEALLGPMGRYDTANVQALEQLPWSSEEYEKISDQMSRTIEIPIIPASYATTRHTKNAFRAVVNDTWNPRYALSAYNRDINAEIERKNEELAKDFN